MLKVENISKAYAGDLLFEKCCFELGSKERCGLVGRNGSGKTTILRMICGLEVPDEGTISMPKDYSLGYLSQHLRFSKKTLLEEASEALKQEEKDCLYKAEKILGGLGFKEEEFTFDPLKFSGGYQLRIHLAKVLIAEPNCLLLDEPTNYLDIVSIRWLKRFLSCWAGELILISHDREFMDGISTHTMGLHRKKMQKIKGGTEKFYSQILHEEKIYERTRLKLEKQKENMEAFVKKLGAKASKASQAQSRVKAIEKMPVLDELAKMYQLHFKFPYSEFPGRHLLEANNLCYSYEKSHSLISDFNLVIEKKSRIAIVGKNGRGKSTLLKLLAQDIVPDKGIIKVSPHIKIGFFGQTNIDRLNPRHTVEEEIAAFAGDLKIGQIRSICGQMMFPKEKAQKSISVLSGGEKSRVLLGKILASPCNLLLLDEPTNHLDMESIAALIEAIKNFEGAVVIVSHSEQILSRLISKFVICHFKKQESFEGDYVQFLQSVGWENEAINKPNSVSSASNRKEDRRRRAEIVQQRAKVLQPMQRKISDLEEEITTLEKQAATLTLSLIEMKKNNESGSIAQLSKEINLKRKRIEDLFLELEKISVEFEKKQEEFEVLLQ